MARLTIGKRVVKQHTKRKGIHAKTKQTFNKNADNYIKRNRGQGR